jgi:hypothetical protein
MVHGWFIAVYNRKCLAGAKPRYINSQERAVSEPEKGRRWPLWRTCHRKGGYF